MPVLKEWNGTTWVPVGTADTTTPPSSGGGGPLGTVYPNVSIGPSSGVTVTLLAGVGGGVCTPFVVPDTGWFANVFVTTTEALSIEYLDLTVVSADGALYVDLSNATAIDLASGLSGATVDFGDDFESYDDGSGTLTVTQTRIHVPAGHAGLYFANLFAVA